MPQGNGITTVDERHLLVERIAASRYLSRSARLRDLLLYLSDRVLEGDAAEIHEQEVGHRVFGRPVDYDTSSDNIVRVHASTLRKRLEQYFAAEGSGEALLMEIPKGNYAPVFRERTEPEIVPAPQGVLLPVRDRRVTILAAAALLFACSTAFLLVRQSAPQASRSAAAVSPTVRQFWPQVFAPDHPTDIVLDDAAV